MVMRQSPGDDEPTADTTQKRTKRSRVNTRARLLEATEALLAESGFEGISIDAICRKAGFSRGAFYSSFRTVPDVYFAIYQQKSTAGLEMIRQAVHNAHNSLAEGAAPETTVRKLLATLPADVTWFTLRATFLTSAQTDPEQAAVFRAQGEAFVAGVEPLVASLADAAGATLTPGPGEATRILIAAYLGAVMQGPLVNDPERLLQDTILAAWRGILTEPTGDTDEP